MKIIDQSWNWVQLPRDPLLITEMAGRTCYKSEDKITDDSAKKFVKSIIKRGHETVIEHVSATVRIITNRGVTHELVRHRLSSFSQESTRYVKYDGGMEFIKPVWIDAEINEAGDNFLEDSSETGKETAAICTWVESLEKDEKAYCSLLKDGWRPEQAREVLPNSLKTEIVMTANMREWRHVFNLRCSQAAHPQIRMIMLDMLNEFHEEFPGMFDDLAEQYLPNKCKAD